MGAVTGLREASRKSAASKEEHDVHAEGYRGAGRIRDQFRGRRASSAVTKASKSVRNIGSIYLGWRRVENEKIVKYRSMPRSASSIWTISGGWLSGAACWAPGPAVTSVGRQQGLGHRLVADRAQPPPDRERADGGGAEIGRGGKGPAVHHRVTDLDPGGKSVRQKAPGLAFEDRAQRLPRQGEYPRPQDAGYR